MAVEPTVTVDHFGHCDHPTSAADSNADSYLTLLVYTGACFTGLPS